MPKPNLTECVSSPDNGETWDFRCSYPDGCGEPGGDGFASTGWPSPKVARARGRQHFDEHEGKGAAQSLHDFREANGVTA